MAWHGCNSSGEWSITQTGLGVGRVKAVRKFTTLEELPHSRLLLSELTLYSGFEDESLTKRSVSR